MAGGKLTDQQRERLHTFAHDLKNRLSGLHQALKHVSGEPAMDKQELVEFGEQQFFKALGEIESMLDDLGVERGVPAMGREPVMLAEVVKEAAEDLKFRFERKDQPLRLELDEAVKVSGDRHYIKESVAALLSNASKFSPMESAVDVVLKEEDGYAELCVVDHGVGLTQEDLQRIFTRYAWLSSHTTGGEPQGRSTLSRTRQWARAMDGDITVASEGEGQGCTFSLRLPLA